jgi:hypothetical protein
VARPPAPRRARDAAAAQVLLASVVTVGVSAIASNTATTAIMLVVLREAVAAPLLPTDPLRRHARASCDFALPAGTPPNAIVFGSGYVSLPRMARTGVLLDLLAAVMVAAWCWLIVPLVIRLRAGTRAAIRSRRCATCSPSSPASLSTLIFHQGLLAILHRAGASPRPAYGTKPVPVAAGRALRDLARVLGRSPGRWRCWPLLARWDGSWSYWVAWLVAGAVPAQHRGAPRGDAAQGSPGSRRLRLDPRIVRRRACWLHNCAPGGLGTALLLQPAAGVSP